MEGILCSIIIASRNEEKFIENCIETLEDQEFDKSKYEIIVIDGQSEDNTVNIIKKLQAKNNNIALLSNPEKIASSAFNKGIEHSRGQYVFILGAHAVYPPNFIRKSINTIIANNVDCVGGRNINIGKGSLGEVYAAVRNTAFGGGLSPYRYSKRMQYVSTVAFGCYTREVLKRVGGFNVSLVKNQDNDLNKRIIQIGGRILFDPDIEFYYFTRDSLKGIFKQMFGYGFWEAKLIKIDRTQLSIITLVPALFVLYTFFAVLMLLLKGNVIPLCLEFVPYLLIFSYFAIRVIMPKKQNIAIALFLYLLIHFSIGIGLIAGIFNRTKR